MKHKSVETTKLYEPSLREKILIGIGNISTLNKRRFKNLVSALAVAAALFGPNGGVESPKAQKVLASETIDDIQEDLIRTGQDISAWVREKGLPAAKQGYEVASKNVSQVVETATPVVEQAVEVVSQTVGDQVEQNVKPAAQQAQQAVGDLFDYSIKAIDASLNPSASETIRFTQPSNKTVELKISDIEDAGLQNTIVEQSESITDTSEVLPNPTPTNVPRAQFGSEVTEGRFRKELHEELNVSLERPFNYKEANDIFESLGLTAEDLINAELVSKDRSKLADFSDPAIPSLHMFPDLVMRWSPLIDKLNSKYNNLEKYGFNTIGNTEFLGLIYVESYGTLQEKPNYAGAVSPAQVTIYPIKALAPGNTVEDKYKFASIPENGIEMGYVWQLMNKRNNQIKFEERGITDPLIKSTINFMTYNGGQYYSFIIAEGGVNSVRDKIDTLQMEKYGIMNRNLYNNYQVFAEAYKQGFEVSYEDSLDGDDDLKMFQSDLLTEILEKAYQKKRQTDGSYRSMREVLSNTLNEYENKKISLYDIKKEIKPEDAGDLYNDVTLPPAVRAVVLFYNR